MFKRVTLLFILIIFTICSSIASAKVPEEDGVKWDKIGSTYVGNLYASTKYISYMKSKEGFDYIIIPVEEVFTSPYFVEKIKQMRNVDVEYSITRYLVHMDSSSYCLIEKHFFDGADLSVLKSNVDTSWHLVKYDNDAKSVYKYLQKYIKKQSEENENKPK